MGIDQTSLGQEKIFFNPSLNSFLMSPSSIMPSAYNQEKIWLSVNYKNRVGLLSEIRDIYLDGAYRKENSLLGLSIYSEQQSINFTKNKFNFLYAYRINVSPKSTLSLGSKVGLSSINFAPSNQNAGKSDQAFDMSFSGSYRLKEINLSLALHQLTNSKLQPNTEIFSLERYLELLISNKFNLNKSLNYEAGINSQFNLNEFLWRIDNVFSKDDNMVSCWVLVILTSILLAHSLILSFLSL